MTRQRRYLDKLTHEQQVEIENLVMSTVVSASRAVERALETWPMLQ